ncbi:chemotaxis protein CheW, partial [Azoarcus sp. TTM-91]|uniref:cache domain-containing protein n=1 Tax=Azoarcus sp. TTM-91 TaxID=2691581 RepID=UPI00145F3E74
MTAYKGIEIAPGLRPLLRHMESVDEYREMLQRLQAVWDNLALLGQLSGMATDMGSTRQAFADLTTSLLNNLGLETRRKVVQEMRARAQVAVDILTRNLFERTADIGFLATDDDLRRHAAGGEHAPSRAAIVARFRDYVRKYSVYDDIVLLAPDGEVLARLDERCPVERSGDPLIAEALATPAAYLEHFRPSDLYPGRGPVLLYAYRVTAEDGTPLAVLCLSFRFDNEMARVFANLRRAGDWHVIALLDAEGRVLASSDQQQLPLAAHIETVLDADCRVVRHGGRQYLAATRP